MPLLRRGTELQNMTGQVQRNSTRVWAAMAIDPQNRSLTEGRFEGQGVPNKVADTGYTDPLPGVRGCPSSRIVKDEVWCSERCRESEGVPRFSFFSLPMSGGTPGG